MEPRFML